MLEAPVQPARITPPITRQLTATLRDGTEIVYRAWLPSGPVRGAVVMFHRGHEHSGRFQDLVERLALADIAIFAWDQRGHGLSPGERGHAESFAAIVRDAESFVRHVSREHCIAIEDMTIMGHSVGAVIVATWVHDYAPPIRGMILVTPALRVRLYVPLAIPMLRLLSRVRRKASVKSYVKAKMLTHDAAQAADYAADKLISRNIAVNILLDLHDTSTRLLADAAAIRTPTLLLAAGSDWVVSLPAQRAFFERLGSTDKDMTVYDGMYHAMLHEQDRDRPIARMRQFIEQRLQAGPLDGYGATMPSPHTSGPVSGPGMVRRAGFAAASVFLRTVGRLSAGIRMGWTSGFDSGQSLDHVYRNRAEGTSIVGRLIDRAYLDSPGWKGIRARKINLQRLLERAIREVHASGRPVCLLDIAAGPGRYVLDTISRLPEISISAVLRDRDPGGLALGRQIAAQSGVAGVTYETGDAFDPTSLAAVRPRPTITIASGLYELFSDNALVARSLRGLFDALEDGGLLIYTNQPWHPQLEFIAHVLTNRDGRPWVMRCRPQAEMDRLVAEAGFTKVAMEIDDKGIFTVSLAMRNDRGLSHRRDS